MNVDKIRGLLTAGLGAGEKAGLGAGEKHARGEPQPNLIQAPPTAESLSPSPAPSPSLARRSRWRVPIGATIIIVLVAFAGAVAVSAFTPQGANTVIGTDGSASDGSVAGDSAAGGDLNDASGAPTSGGIPIFVHILGAVRLPGLYELREGDRAIDAVAAAGGFLAEADLNQLNLARFVGDGEQIVVAVIGAIPPAGGSGLAASGIVNINTADAATLETLPRVGPAMSARIIAWRDQNGRFAVIEDLMNVSGIGEKTFDGLKALISI